MVCEYRLPDRRRPCSRVLAAGRLPVLVVLPIAHQRRIKGILIARHGVLSPKEMPAGIHIPDCLQTELVLRTVNRRQHVCQVLQHFNIENKFLVRSDETPFQPTRSMVDHIPMTHDGAPECHLGLIGALCINHV